MQDRSALPFQSPLWMSARPALGLVLAAAKAGMVAGTFGRAVGGGRASPVGGGIDLFVDDPGDSALC